MTKTIRSVFLTFALLILVGAEIFCFSFGLQDGHVLASASISEATIGGENSSNVTFAKSLGENQDDPFKNVTIDPIPDQIYTGEMPNPKIVVRDGDNVLVEGVDYNVKISSTPTFGEADTTYYEITITVRGINNYANMEKITNFYVFSPEPDSIRLDLDGIDNVSIKTNKEWTEFVESNLKLSFKAGLNSYPLTDWQIKNCYIDTTHMTRLDDGSALGVYGFVEVQVPKISSFDREYTIVKKFYIPNYTGNQEHNYTFPIIMSCSILGAVLVSATIYYTITAIRKKKNIEKD